MRSDRYWEEVEVGKRWRLVRGGGWQEVEIGKRWRLARGGGKKSINLFALIFVTLYLIGFTNISKKNVKIVIIDRIIK